MPRKPDKRVEQAKEMYLKGEKLVEIASQLGLPEGTVRRWKSTYKWGNERSNKKGERSNKKRGGQPGNKNAVGGKGPLNNRNAEKHGFFSKHLPKEALSILEDIEGKEPLDILWENIQIAYAAIVRAQRLMYEREDEEMPFLAAQARAQSELRSLIRQYTELLHANYDLATEEQKARIAQIKAKTAILNGECSDEATDDGFIKALKEGAKDIWADD